MNPTLPPNTPEEPSEMMDISIGQPSLLPSQNSIEPTIMSHDNTISTWLDIGMKMIQDYSSFRQCLEHFKAIRGDGEIAEEKTRIVILGDQHARAHRYHCEAGRTLDRTKPFDHEPERLRSSINTVNSTMEVLTDEWKDLTQKYKTDWLRDLRVTTRKVINSIDEYTIREQDLDNAYTEEGQDKNSLNAEKQELILLRNDLRNSWQATESRIAYYRDHKQILQHAGEFQDPLLEATIEEWEELSRDWKNETRLDMGDLGKALDDDDSMDIS